MCPEGQAVQVRPSVQDLGLGFRILTGVRDGNSKKFSIIIKAINESNKNNNDVNNIDDHNKSNVTNNID